MVAVVGEDVPLVTVVVNKGCDSCGGERDGELVLETGADLMDVMVFRAAAPAAVVGVEVLLLVKGWTMDGGKKWDDGCPSDEGV